MEAGEWDLSKVDPNELAQSQATLIFGQMNEPPGARASVALSGLTVAESFRDTAGKGPKDILFFISSTSSSVIQTDALGKDTQIALIEKEFEKRSKAVHIVHYSNIKLDTNDAIKVASQIRYREMFNLMSSVPENNVLIFNRCTLL